MSDGGHVCLDWFNERGCDEDDSSGDGPIILILPGATG